MKEPEVHFFNPGGVLDFTEQEHASLLKVINDWHQHSLRTYGVGFPSGLVFSKHKAISRVPLPFLVTLKYWGGETVGDLSWFLNFSKEIIFKSSMRDLFLGQLVKHNLTLADVEVIYLAGVEISWEDFALSGAGLSTGLYDNTPDVLFIGKSGDWWIEVAEGSLDVRFYTYEDVKRGVLD